MVIKTIFMLSLYTIPYILMITDVFGSVSGMWIMYALMGLGSAGIGLSIMHDANHGSYSAKRWVNMALGYTLNFIGGHAFLWKIQHNVLHHTYTNVHDVDEDISPRGVLRMAPGSKWKPMHRWQYLYAWFFYGLMTFVWVIQKDFKSIIKYQKHGWFETQRASLGREWTIMVLTKVFYFSYVLIIPAILLPYSWFQLFLGFCIMHYIAGFILAIVFQPAHVIDGTEYPVVDESGNLENNWAIHQLHTTTNFGHRHRVFSWYVGGLNYQVEHHLFPNICHVHYRSIAPIVKATALEFGLPYKSKNTFIEAMVAHTKLLKELGKKPIAA